MQHEAELSIEDVLVSRTQLDTRVTEACAHVVDPNVGLFGPSSKLWEVNREAIVFLGAGRASLLQLAHPWVAYGVEHHSLTRYAELTAWLMPERLSRGFGLSRGGRLGKLRFDATLGALRAVHPRLPDRARFLPHYLNAMRRVRGDTRPDPLGESMARLLVGEPSHPVR